MISFRRKSASRNRPKKAAAGWLARLPTLPWRRLAPIGGALLVLTGVVMGVRTALDQPVERVAISGRFQRVQPLDVEKAVRGAAAGSGMVSVDLARIAASVEQIPWVDRASVARSWPSGLRVQVVEQVPVARWGETGLVNMRGEVFVQDSRHIPVELPQLVGPAGYEAQMTSRYLDVQQRLVEGGLRVTRLTLDERGAWEFSLDNGVQLRLGREHVDERFDRFLAAAAQVVTARATEIAYVDMRYANGFAVGWRSGKGEVKRG
ncbi:MAG: cell division protein FtsQ/DivIB [Steroidobacteraceae bacterium]